MSTFKERLATEKTELDTKIDKLELFMSSDKYDSIEPIQMSLLNIQAHAMLTYSQCLLERIAWLEAEEEVTVV